MTLAKVLQLSEQARGTAEKVRARDKGNSVNENAESAPSVPGAVLSLGHNLFPSGNPPPHQPGRCCFADGGTELQGEVCPRLPNFDSGLISHHF